MAEAFVQLGADGTGKMMRSRSRVPSGSTNTVHEQYVIALPTDRVVSARAYVSSFRQWSRAVTAQPIFTLWNGGTNLVSIRRLTLEADQNPVASAAGGAPYARLYRLTAAPTGGTVLAKGQQDTAETTSANIVATGDMASDTAVATTPLAFTPAPTTHLWQQPILKWHGTAGLYVPPVMNMIPDDPNLNQEEPIYLRPNQGVGIRLEAQAAMVLQTTAGAAGAYYLFVKCAFAEFTFP